MTTNNATTVNPLIILGASDPEMTAIEQLARDAGLTVAYATAAGVRVRPGQMATSTTDACPHCGGMGGATGEEVEACHAPRPNRPVVLVEVAGLDHLRDGAVIIDHHAPGDPGYGVKPAQFLAGSSVGQFIRWLAHAGHVPATWLDVERNAADDAPAGTLCYSHAVWLVAARGWQKNWASRLAPPVAGMVWHPVPRDIVLCAAADHCLSAAYRGECPGVDPDALGRWRAQSRAEFQRRSVEAVLADVEAARAVLASAPRIELGQETVVDLLGLDRQVPELPEAAARDGVAVLVRGIPGPDGRVKVNLLSAGEGAIRAFLGGAVPGLVDHYGDPARGFAGAYLP